MCFITRWIPVNFHLPTPTPITSKICTTENKKHTNRSFLATDLRFEMCGSFLNGSLELLQIDEIDPLFCSTITIFGFFILFCSFLALHSMTFVLGVWFGYWGGLFPLLYIVRAIFSADMGGDASSGIRRNEREWQRGSPRITGISTGRASQGGQGRNRGAGLAVGSFGIQEEEQEGGKGDAQRVSPDKGVLLFDAQQVQY